ncbi:protein PET117 homolog, mitochondrial isoform X1 [Dromiciops gliroides]|uniref:protein PET117 homolog, mitochondrial isoform X1 n=1 Tax=Dromiciops gliroides TaxID=33562 RepID=UPI001CC5E953|nr:protein PET117 homolog, mitochondrial isoform X1 [Dromiciops gliroides]
MMGRVLALPLWGFGVKNGPVKLETRYKPKWSGGQSARREDLSLNLVSHLIERLRDGVLRDIERQNRKKENVRILEEQIILTEHLEAERKKMLLAKGSQKT